MLLRAAVLSSALLFSSPSAPWIYECENGTTVQVVEVEESDPLVFSHDVQLRAGSASDPYEPTSASSICVDWGADDLLYGLDSVGLRLPGDSAFRPELTAVLSPGSVSGSLRLSVSFGGLQEESTLRLQADGRRPAALALLHAALQETHSASAHAEFAAASAEAVAEVTGRWSPCAVSALRAQGTLHDLALTDGAQEAAGLLFALLDAVQADGPCF